MKEEELQQKTAMKNKVMTIMKMVAWKSLPLTALCIPGMGMIAGSEALLADLYDFI